MQPDDRTANPEFRPASGPPVGGAAPVRTTPHVSLWLCALAGSLIAGLASWRGGEATYGYFKPQLVRAPDWNKMNTYERQDYMSEQIRQKRPVAETKNTAVAFGLLGAALAGALGLAGGLARRSARAGLVAAAVGVVAGVAAGAGLASVMSPYFFRNLDPDPEKGQLLPFLTHGGIWAAIGLAGGLAFGVGLGARRRMPGALLGALLGAILATLVFESVNAAAFPLVRVFEPVPADRTLRLLAHLCVAVLVAIGAVLGVEERAPVQHAPPRTT